METDRRQEKQTATHRSLSVVNHGFCEITENTQIGLCPQFPAQSS